MTKGITNSSDFKFTLQLETTCPLNPQGGIRIIELPDFEVIIEAAGLSLLIIEKISATTHDPLSL